MLNEMLDPNQDAKVSMVMGSGLVEKWAPHFRYDVECLDSEGNIRWAETFDNIVTFQGQNDLLTQYFKGVTYTAAWFVALIDDDGSTDVPLESDTAASHPGWVEHQDYTEGTREALTLGTASSGSIDNSASRASFSINADGEIKGAFVISNSTKGGSTGILYSAGNFTVPRQALNGDVLNVTITLQV